MHSSISVELRHVTESWTVAMAHADLIDGRLTNEDLKSENRTRKVEIIEVAPSRYSPGLLDTGVVRFFCCGNAANPSLDIRDNYNILGGLFHTTGIAVYLYVIQLSRVV